MNETQFLAERLARLAERLAVLEAGQSDALATGNRTTLNGVLTVANSYSLVLESINIPNGHALEIASGGSLVLVG